MASVTILGPYPTMLDNWREKLAKLIPDGKMKDVSIKSGLGPTAVRDIITERSKDPSFTTIAKIANQVGASLDEIANNEARKTAATINVVGEVAAGSWREVAESGMDSDWGFAPIESPFPPDPRYPITAQFDVIVKGTSINRFARDGENLRCVNLVNSTAVVEDDDLVIVRRKRFDGQMIETTAKRVKRRDGVFELWPDSDDERWQEPIVLDPKKAPAGEEAEILALVLYAYHPARRR